VIFYVVEKVSKTNTVQSGCILPSFGARPPGKINTDTKEESKKVRKETRLRDCSGIFRLL
jgi:hypothetical protein